MCGRVVARVIAAELGKKPGQAVVVDNRPGARGSVGGLRVSQAPADGYTLMLGNSTPSACSMIRPQRQPAHGKPDTQRRYIIHSCLRTIYSG